MFIPAPDSDADFDMVDEQAVIQGTSSSDNRPRESLAVHSEFCCNLLKGNNGDFHVRQQPQQGVEGCDRAFIWFVCFPAHETEAVQESDHVGNGPVQLSNRTADLDRAHGIDVQLDIAFPKMTGPKRETKTKLLNRLRSDRNGYLPYVM